MNRIFYLLTFLIVSSCSEKNEQNSNMHSSGTDSNVYNNSISDESDDRQYDHGYMNSSDENYHTDPDYKYEYRTGSSGNYEYNYDVSGTDYDGNGVYGNIDMQGKYGSGYVENDNGEEIYLDVEWVDYGVLEGIDEDGNSYELGVDE